MLAPQSLKRIFNFSQMTIARSRGRIHQRLCDSSLKLRPAHRAGGIVMMNMAGELCQRVYAADRD
jgi:hypothetical protein